MENGEILLSGGSFMEGTDLMYVSSSQMYSLLTQTWQPIADMQALRTRHTLTKLHDSRHVLAVGAVDLFDAYTAEIYDSEANTWSFVETTMDVGRFGHTATLLRNGHVLIVGGGEIMSESMHSNVQLYDPPLDTFISTSSLNRARRDHTATLLSDGLSVLVVGGGTLENDNRTTAEVYIKGVWSYTTNDMIVTRYHHAAVLLSDGNVLVAGGTSIYDVSISTTVVDDALSSVEIYNSVTRTFSLAQPMACERAKLTLTLLPSGQVLATGGISSSQNECLLACELYDPTTGQWMSTRLLNSVRYGHTTILLNNSVVLAIGGHIDDKTPAEQCERYHL